MRLLPLLLFLSACGAPSHTYRQGIPVAPSAPAFNPAWDAPVTTGQPGYVGPAENLPRSPHGRVLPETPDTRREPGLWAGDEPRAAKTPPWATWPTTVLGVALPPLEDLADESFQQQVQKCSYLISRVADDDVIQRSLKELSPEQLQCFVARMNLYCAWEDEQYLGRIKKTAKAPPPGLRDAIHKHYAGAKRFEAAKCGEDDDAEVASLVRYGMSRWRTALGGVYEPN